MSAWTDSGGASIPQLLRSEYPDLMKKWDYWNHQQQKFELLHREMKKFGFFGKMFAAEAYSKIVDKTIIYMDKADNAREEYLFLEKLLWPVEDREI